MAGFTALRNQGDTDYQGKLETYNVAAAHATLLAPGDVVVITGTADAKGRAQVDAAAAGAAITGVIASVAPMFDGENLTETGLPALTAGDVLCHIPPTELFTAAVINGPLVVTDVGLNIDIDETAATKTGGLTVSNMTLDAATVATTATLQFRIIGLTQPQGGALGDTAIVRFNATTVGANSAGI